MQGYKEYERRIINNRTRILYRASKSTSKKLFIKHKNEMITYKAYKRLTKDRKVGGTLSKRKHSNSRSSSSSLERRAKRIKNMNQQLIDIFTNKITEYNIETLKIILVSLTSKNQKSQIIKIENLDESLSEDFNDSIFLYHTKLPHPFYIFKFEKPGVINDIRLYIEDKRNFHKPIIVQEYDDQIYDIFYKYYSNQLTYIEINRDDGFCFILQIQGSDFQDIKYIIRYIIEKDLPTYKLKDLSELIESIENQKMLEVLFQNMNMDVDELQELLKNTL